MRRAPHASGSTGASLVLNSHLMTLGIERRIGPEPPRLIVWIRQDRCALALGLLVVAVDIRDDNGDGVGQVGPPALAGFSELRRPLAHPLLEIIVKPGHHHHTAIRAFQAGDNVVAVPIHPKPFAEGEHATQPLDRSGRAVVVEMGIETRPGGVAHSGDCTSGAGPRAGGTCSLQPTEHSQPIPRRLVTSVGRTEQQSAGPNSSLARGLARGTRANRTPGCTNSLISGPANHR